MGLCPPFSPGKTQVPAPKKEVRSNQTHRRSGEHSFSSITLSFAHKRCTVDCYLPLFSVVEAAQQRDPLREDHGADSSLSFAKKAETPLPDSILSSAHPL